MSPAARRSAFEKEVRDSREALIALCGDLVRIDSQNPPGDTGKLADAIATLLAKTPDIETRQVTARPPAVNLIARIAGVSPGRRLILNGHLDTFPVGDAARWTVPPLGGTLAGGRIYGRGAADMKAGLAAAILAGRLLARHRAAWSGELVLTLVGDEETGGLWGTQHLLKTVPEAAGDAMLSADAGSPQVVRTGEKGQIWLEITAAGKANHGAHVHLGINAIERLMAALERLTALRALPCPIPPAVRAVMELAQPVSEAVSGAGEGHTLSHVTLNIGRIEGGSAVNIIPDAARALCDVRIPPGLTVADIVREVGELIGDLPGIGHRVLSATEPTVTDPDHECVRLAVTNAAAVVSGGTVVNMRVGFSDARFYRLYGVPSIVYGPTPHNMGGPDEYVTIDDLFAVFYVHAMTAFDFLSRAP
ncbi:MAG TPA: M20/M25/M40 family metallo-hydrolase [Stellaceae bacterium]|nr:M20/M25/M40 family metallo-hydrolase [Stellaceae bacterium]